MKDVIAVAEALSQAITTLDLPAVAKLYSDDTVVWHSYDRAEQDKVATLAFLGDFFEKVAELRYADVRRLRTEEGFVQQHVIHVSLKTGEVFEPRPVCLIAKVVDGQILRIDEYLEARRVAAAA